MSYDELKPSEDPPPAPWSRLRHLLPDALAANDIDAFIRAATHVSVLRTLYFSARHREWIIASRGTRLKSGPGSRILVPKGSRLMLGLAHFTPTPCSVHLGKLKTGGLA